jgi:hypothetical protein
MLIYVTWTETAQYSMEIECTKQTQPVTPKCALELVDDVIDRDPCRTQTRQPCSCAHLDKLEHRQVLSVDVVTDEKE